MFLTILTVQNNLCICLDIKKKSKIKNGRELPGKDSKDEFNDFDSYCVLNTVCFIIPEVCARKSKIRNM